MALTKRYVRSDADGAGDGTTDANSGATGSFTWAQMITDLNTPRAGYKYLVKSGTYANGTTTTTLTGDGTTTSPNVIEGFNSTEGDLDSNGRDSNGALVTTNFPVVSYTGTTARFNASSADYLVVRCLSITSAASNPTVSISTGGCLDQCIVSNTGTNSLSSAIGSSVGISSITNCDGSTAATGAPCAVKIDNGLGVVSVVGCRLKCVPGAGILGGGFAAIGNTIYESTNGMETNANGNCRIIGNTVANCTGSGIVIAAAQSLQVFIVGNHITGNGAYGINFNAATCGKVLLFNRFRDNTTANWSDTTNDHILATSQHNITSDDTDATDFTDQANDNYSLLTTAAAITAGIGYRNPIGASGAGSFGGSSGGVTVPTRYFGIDGVGRT